MLPESLGGLWMVKLTTSSTSTRLPPGVVAPELTRDWPPLLDLWEPATVALSETAAPLTSLLGPNAMVVTMRCKSPAGSQRCAALMRLSGSGSNGTCGGPLLRVPLLPVGNCDGSGCSLDMLT